MRGVTKNVEGRGKQETRRGRLAAGGVYKVSCAVQIDCARKLRLFIALRRDDEGEMDNRVLTKYSFVYSLNIADIAGKVFHLRMLKGRI